ncbi:MAG TPA: hypothetical protein VL359_18120 [bacterium]|nr:hypothetical protein [bacterium]
MAVFAGICVPLKPSHAVHRPLERCTLFVIAQHRAGLRRCATRPHRAGRLRIQCAAWYLALTLALLCLWPGARASAQLLQGTGSAEVPVLQDNLDTARVLAVRQAQTQAMSQALDSLLAPEWRKLYDKDLKQKLFSRMDSYLSAFRTDTLEPSPDRTRYQAVVVAQFSRIALTQDLREMGLPILGDPKRSLRIAYDARDPVMARPALRQAVLAQLQARLDLLNFKVNGTAALAPDQAKLLAETPAQAQRRTSLLESLNVEAVLWLQFHLALGRPHGEKDVQATLFQTAGGISRGSFAIQSAAEPAKRLTPKVEEDFVLSALVAPLVNQMVPTQLQAFRAPSGASGRLTLQVQGLRSVADQDAFETQFFRPSTPFARMELTAFDSQAVTYEGPFLGNRDTEAQRLQGSTVGEFTIRQARWLGDVLDIQVQRQPVIAHQPPDPFPPAARALNVQDMLQAYLGRSHAAELGDPAYTEHEDNGWLDRATQVPYNASIYGLVDARADGDFYVAENLAEGEVLNVLWTRLDRTNLIPVIRVYDETGMLVKTYQPRLFTRFSYRVPKGQHSFYVEVADRFGYLPNDTGGYLKFPYLLTVLRTAASQ